MRGFVMLLVLTLAGCDPPRVFHCRGDAQCGAAGACEAVGFCSFADPACTVGRRYGELAPSGLAGACVGAPGVDGGSDAGRADATLDAGAPFDAASDARLGGDAAPDAGVVDAAVALVTSFGENGTDQHAGVTHDTWLGSDAPTVSNGAAAALSIDTSPVRSALVRFDLTALPPGAHVMSAELHLWSNGEAQQATGQRKIGFYKVLEAWSQGAASWNQRQSGVAWSNLGAEQPGSRQATALGELVVNQSATRYVMPVPAAVVQGWVDTPGSNAGLALVAATAGSLSARLESSESTAVAHRPELVVSYRP